MCFHLCHYMGQIVDHILKDYADVFDFSDINIYHSHQKTTVIVKIQRKRRMKFR